MSAENTPRLAASPHHAGPVSTGFTSRIREALALRRRRNSVNRLDDHALEDIGLTRRDIEAAPARTLWDIPPCWTS